MRKLMLLLSPLLLLAAMSHAQQITGNVKDEQGKGLTGASVALKKTKDSSLVKLAVTNTGGQYSFTGITAGEYFVNVSFVGHDAKNSAAFAVNGSGEGKGPEITLSKLVGNLKEVTVAYRKPVIEVKADKTILNVEGSVNAVGTDALELLRKSPGVQVDKDDNLSLSGKNGVQVYIDGRPTPLNGKDLSDYLKTIQSSNIESIEIITNPSAKYDAAGNAGIINIRLKKNKSFGTNGSVNGGYNQGIFPKWNGGISLNHRNKKVNLFGNYSYNDSRNESYMSMYRKQLDTLFDQKSTITTYNKSHAFKAGIDYFVNKWNTVGVMVNGTLTDNEFNNYSRTPISYIPTGAVNKILIADNTAASKRDNANVNLNFRHTDSLNRELNIDADYGLYRIKSNQMQPNYYYDPTGNTLTDSRIYNMVAPTDIDIYSFKTDYETNLKKGRLGVGGKFSYVDSKNDFDRYDVLSGVKKMDTLRSNDFRYKENINALYVNYNRPFKGFLVQVGLRMENTSAKGRSNGFRWDGSDYVTYDSGFNRNYTDFFPSAAVTFNKKPMSQWTLTYSRRIDRPSYQNLNPFEFKLDEYTYQKGNTNLRPQYTNSVGVTWVYKYMLTTTLNYSHINDIFSQLIDTAEKSKSFITQKNLAKQDITSINISYPFMYKWYSVFANLNAYYSRYQANFGPGRDVDLDVYSFTFYAQQSFRFGKGWTGEMTGFYSAPSIWQGTFKSKEMWGIDAGVQKTVLKNKGTVKVAVSDIFKTMKWQGTSNFANQYIKAGGGWESRLLKLSFSYRFGRNEIKAARQRKAGLEDENKRVGAQGASGIGNQ